MISNPETFRLDDDYVGVVWSDDDGWHGAMLWNIQRATYFIGPFTTRTKTCQAIRAEFVAIMAKMKSTVKGAK